MPTDIALLIVRVVVGLLMFAHGAQKLFGWFGGHGLTATSTMMGTHARLRPAKLWTLVGGLSEAGGGLLFALGLLTPLGALGIAAAMITASITVHWGQVLKMPLSYVATAIAVGLIGPGQYSLDVLLGVALPTPATFLYGLVAVLVGVVAMLVTRAPAPDAVVSTAPNSRSTANAA
jgi:putative oxidoreductase